MGGIPPIAFLSSERLDVLWVHQHQIKTPFQDVPHRLPVHASCFHILMGHLMFCKPCGHILEFPGKGPKRRSSFSSLPCSRIITHAEMLFLCTSSPQHRECNTSIHTFLLDAAGS